MNFVIFNLNVFLSKYNKSQIFEKNRIFLKIYAFLHDIIPWVAEPGTRTSAKSNIIY